MRIGLITGEYPPMQGGVGAYAQILARTLAAHGHTVYVLTSKKAQSRHDTEGEGNVHVAPVIHRWDFFTLRKIRRWVQGNQLEVVSLQFETAAYHMSAWVHFLPDFLRGVPVITTFHDLLVPYLYPKAGRLRQWIVMHLAQQSDGVIATNHEDMLRLQHLKHAALIPIGSNIETVLPPDFGRDIWRKKIGACERDFLIAYFGFLNRSKGVETLLQALKQLVSDQVPVKLVMIGGRTGSSDPTNAAYALEIEQLIVQLAMEEYVHWTGFVNDDEVTAYLQASDAVVLPFRDGASYRRGSLMAAIQHDCAIITTEPAVTIPDFQHQGNMLLFPPDDAVTLAECIRALYESAELRQTLKRNVAAIKSQFDWDQIALQYIEFFQQVMA